MISTSTNWQLKKCIFHLILYRFKMEHKRRCKHTWSCIQTVWCLCRLLQCCRQRIYGECQIFLGSRNQEVFKEDPNYSVCLHLQTVKTKEEKRKLKWLKQNSFNLHRLFYYCSLIIKGKWNKWLVHPQIDK
jgi:hypothetical protein